jgi:N utilization substance protein B
MTVAAQFSKQARSAARLAAVQALYQMDIAENDAETVLADLRRRFDAGEAGVPPEARPDFAFLNDLIRGMAGAQPQLDEAIGAALSSSFHLERLEAVLRAILRAGAYELLAIETIPAKVTINEYVDLTHAFFSGREPALVNAVLDRMAVRFRELHHPADDNA